MMRCTFDSQSRKRVTHIGPTHKDEMCRIYIMYYYDPSEYGEVSSLPFETNRFTEHRLRSLTYPDDSDTPKKKQSSLVMASIEEDVVLDHVEEWDFIMPGLV